ncbi:MAG: hypothetical protein H0T51_26825 [Pirellulales bacterium]|nr:hypothetical protein [Pirellulales bacterium]
MQTARYSQANIIKEESGEGNHKEEGEGSILDAVDFFAVLNAVAVP